MSEGHTRESTRLGVVRLLSEVSGISVEKIGDETSLHDLCLDSLDISKLDVCFDERYRFNLEDFYDSATAGMTHSPAELMPLEAKIKVGQIVDYTYKRLSGKPTPAAA